MLNELPGQSEFIEFEGVKIQWTKGSWNFDHENLDPISIDTYSIWNPANHDEIADRLSQGHRAAFYMMGNFGVVEVRGARKSVSERDVLFDDIKQRDRMQSLIAFVHPHDIGEIIDEDRLPVAFKHLKDPERRLALYPGPLHVILPILDDKIVDLGLSRPDHSAGFFWIPGHKGYEALAEKMKGKTDGLLAGGSLNIHGQEPCYTTTDLRDKEMIKHKEWLENIDFVVLDEIAEEGGIGRSHTQISFLTDPPSVIRIGSISPAKILGDTGIVVVVNDDGVKYASSLTPYDELHNVQSDRRVEDVLARIPRYQEMLSSGGISSGPQI